MKEKTNTFGLKAVTYSILISYFLYTSLAFLAIYMFGSAIKPSVLDNIGDEEYLWESYVLRGVFLIVIGCHIPFVFFSGKESLLIIVDEFDRKSVSKALEDILTSNRGEYKPTELDRLVDHNHNSLLVPETPKQI